METNRYPRDAVLIHRKSSHSGAERTAPLHAHRRWLRPLPVRNLLIAIALAPGKSQPRPQKDSLKAGTFKTQPLISYLPPNPDFLINMSFGNLISLVFKYRYGKATRSRQGGEGFWNPRRIRSAPCAGGCVKPSASLKEGAGGAARSGETESDAWFALPGAPPGLTGGSANAGAGPFSQ